MHQHDAPFSDHCTRVRVEILDEPYESDVRVYPG